MAPGRLSILTFGFWVLCQSSPGSYAAETNVLRFTQPAPYSSEEEIGRRFGYAVVPPDYDLSRERFLVTVPSNQETNRLGLLVWLSPGDQPEFPPAWEEELASHHFIRASPLQSGDDRHPIDRLRMALDLTCNVCRKYRIDRKRIYVGGFGGGARLASMLGIACGDIFTGTLCVCGVNFHLHVPVDGTQYYPGSFYPNLEIVQYARTKDRFVLVTCESDPSFDRIKATADLGFRRDGFKNVLLLLAPGIGQVPPEPATLNQALAFLGANADSSAAVPRSSESKLPTPNR